MFIVTVTIAAQAPQGFNYQATVRNNAGALIINKSVSFKFNIIPTSASGTAVYSESQTVTTDDLGQVSLVIGKGTATTGTFATIDWATGTYYLGIELNTGNGFVGMGTSQLLSVPYAMYAKNAGSSEIPNLASVLAKNNSANNAKITNLANPTDAQDAATKNYVDLSNSANSSLGDGKIYVGNSSNKATEVALSGDITIDNIGISSIGSSKVTTGKLADNAVETSKIKDASITNVKLDKANIPLSGFGAATADVAIGGKKLTGVANPSDAQDAVTKNYTDNNILALEQKLQKQINGIESLLKRDSYYVSFKLQDAYNGLWSFQDFDKTFALNEVTTDALVVPTRGGDWDDNGQWRRLHSHSWDSKEILIKNTWNTLLTNVYKCNYVIENGTTSEIVEARFLRAFYYYHVIDLFGKVPYKERGADPNSNPKMWTRIEATSFIISELEAIISNLQVKTIGDASFANKDAAHFLLAKLYLNKSVFTATTPAGPYTFLAADMNKVIQHIDAISSTLSTDYWDNFKPNNHLSSEILFSSKNYIGKEMGAIRSRWYMSSHYNQTPSGWNGFSILSEFYDTFNPTDRRIKNSDPAIISDFGNPMGMQIGQQYAPGGSSSLRTRGQAGSNLLIFTRDVLLNLPFQNESAGIRPQKYIPDINNIDMPENDYVLFRYADALLMKAEAIVRGGASNTSLSSITSLLTSRTGITTTTNLSTLEGIYKARGNELWLEGWRRNDMIRFGKFLNARQLKPTVSAFTYILFPIPYDELINTNFTQNPGY